MFFLFYLIKTGFKIFISRGEIILIINATIRVNIIRFVSTTVRISRYCHLSVGKFCGPWENLWDMSEKLVKVKLDLLESQLVPVGIVILTWENCMDPGQMLRL